MEQLFESEEIETEIDINKRFHFPTDIVVKKFDGTNLVIYTEGVLWLVFSDIEMEVFNQLSFGASIAEVLEQFDETVVINVLSQIEAKQFEHPIVREKTSKNIYIYLTNNCNERCRHCYMYSGEIKIQELSPDVWKRVLLEFKENNGEGVTFTGGEITVYQDYKSILEYAHEIGLMVTVLTNGIKWSKEEIQSCAALIDEVQISIDGYDKDSYYQVRQYDGFEKAVETLIDFNNAKVRTSMAVTPLYDDLDAFVENFEPFAQSIIEKYPEIYIRFNLELLDGRDVRKTEIGNANYRRKIRGLVERLYPDYYIETFPLNYEGHVIRKNCGFGEIAIAANGDVYWCNRIHELTSKWNITTDAFSDILNASEQIKSNTDVDNSLPCKNCEIKYICGGNCRMNYEGIQTVDSHTGPWNTKCTSETKEGIYRKMILANEYFYMAMEEEK